MDRKKILIAEDAETMRETLSFLLANRGYEVAKASNGREALKLAKTFSPDLIVLGAELPEISGYDVYRYLKMDPSSQQIPVLLLVAFTETCDAPTRTLPSSEFLFSKPFTAHDFLQRVQKLLSEAPEPARP